MALKIRVSHSPLYHHGSIGQTRIGWALFRASRVDLDWWLPLGLLRSQIRKPKLDFDAQAFDAQGTSLAPVMDGTVSLKILNPNPKIS